MRRILYCLLLALLVIPGLVGAKVVDEGNQVFSVDIPEAWTFKPKEKAWSNANNTGALVLSSVDVKISLDQWAKNAATQNPNTVVSKDKLGGQPASRLEFVAQGGYKTYLWISKKGNKGAIVTLVHNKACPDDIPAIKKKLLSSFQWKAAAPKAKPTPKGK